MPLSRERCGLHHALGLARLGLSLGCVALGAEPLQVGERVVVVVVDVVALGPDSAARGLVRQCLTLTMSTSLDR
jgi:hypothetical protein